MPSEWAAPLQLQRHIATKNMLVVLDNYEHLLAGVSLAADLLRACSNLTLLATSRERLNLKEEWLFAVEGLPFAGKAVDEHTDASKLFAERARQAQPAFSLAENVPAVREICRLVEGSPLGLELAAVWVRVMPCAEIAAEISNLDFLTTNARNVAERHRSLRAAFEHSWHLLNAREQDVFRKLSVFKGGFTREAAAEVVGSTIPLLLSLVDKSLLRVGERERFDRHVLLQQYAQAQEKLSEHPEQERVEAKHAAYFSDLAEHLAFETDGSQPGRAYARLEAELENFRAAWGWVLAHKSARTFAACGKAFGQYFLTVGGAKKPPSCGRRR